MIKVELNPQNTIRWEDYKKVCMALVHSTRAKWDYLIDESELVSIGMETFVKAVEKYDPKEHEGVTFGYFYHRALRNEFTNYTKRMRLATMRAYDPEVLKDTVAVNPTQHLALECADMLQALQGDALELVRMVLVELRGALSTAEPRQMRGLLRGQAASKGWSRRRYDTAFLKVQSVVMAAI